MKKFVKIVFYIDPGVDNCFICFSYIFFFFVITANYLCFQNVRILNDADFWKLSVLIFTPIWTSRRWLLNKSLFCGKFRTWNFANVCFFCAPNNKYLHDWLIRKFYFIRCRNGITNNSVGRKAVGEYKCDFNWMNLRIRRMVFNLGLFSPM